MLRNAMDFDPQAMSVVADPYPVFRELRDHHPVFYSAERGLWVVSRYEDVRAVLLDAETFASGMGMLWIYGYLDRVLGERERQPADDLVSHLLQPGPGETRLTHDEVVGFCALLLMAGTETTTNALGNAIVLLHAHPEVRGRLAARPEGLGRAIEELLRLESPVPGLSRVTTRDVEIHGVKIPKSARVQMAFAAANRDERVFPQPDRIDPARTPNPHLAFGVGTRFCLGASLARSELRIAIEELLARFPDFQVDPARGVRLRSDAARGFSLLPCVGRP